MPIQPHRPLAPFAPSLHRAWSSRLKSASRRGVSPCFVYPHLSWRPHHRTIAVIPPASTPLQPCGQPLYTDPGPSEISSMFFYVVVGSLLFFCNPGAALWPPEPHAPTVGCTTTRSPNTRQKVLACRNTTPFYFLSFTCKQTLALTSLTHAAIPEPPVGQCCRCRHQSDEHVPQSTSTRRQAQWCAQLCCCHVKPNLKTPYHCFCA